MGVAVLAASLACGSRRRRMMAFRQNLIGVALLTVLGLVIVNFVWHQILIVPP